MEEENQLFDVDSLSTLMKGETLRQAQQSASVLLAKYGPLKEELAKLEQEVSYASPRLEKLKILALDAFTPNWASFNLGQDDLEDLQFFRFLQKNATSVINHISSSSRNLKSILSLSKVLLPMFSGKVDFGLLVNSESVAMNLLSTANQELKNSQSFDKLLAGVYLDTRREYKQLRKKYLGNTAEVEEDELENQLMSQIFGFKPPVKPQILGPATALIDDNCILTQLLTDLSDIIPAYYKKFVNTKKKTKTVNHLDEGEVEDFAQLLRSASNTKYLKYITDPSSLLTTVLNILTEFHQIYLPVYKSLQELATKEGLLQLAMDLANPAAISRQYLRINFLAIVPDADDVTPKSKLEKDYAVARNKLFNHLDETLLNLSSMSPFQIETEDYSILRTKEAITLKMKMDDILQTDHKKNLSRNIHDDNEFYVAKSGNIGALELEREPAPRIKYEHVIGDSFIKAKEHVEEVVKIASHANLMRASAPRGDIKSNILLIGPYGCHRKGQKILMYDGTLKAVEQIKVGDLLMGPDSTPRTVLRLVRGTDDMVEIIPNKGGNPWVVNRKHTLALKRTQGRINGKYAKVNELVEVEISEYLKWSKNKKTIHPLFRVPVDFKNQSLTLPLDPYFLGIMLGDGCLRNRTSITTVDQPIIAEIYRQSKKWGLQVSIEDSDNRTLSYHLTTGRTGGKPNLVRDKFRALGLFNTDSETKFIPLVYKTSSRSDRLEMLAGIMDTDGSLHGSCSYDYTTKSETLANDVAFISRSLGLAANIKPCRKKSQNGTEGNYFRVEIFGDTEIIPVRISYKKANPRMSNKNVLHTGFKTRKLSTENFYGFTVDIDNLYLLDDFTVTRNCGKTEMAKAIGADQRIIGFNVNVADLLTAYMHESVKNVKRAYEHAKTLRQQSRFTKPVAILLDEFDRLFNYGEGVHSAYDGGRMTGVLQEMMDGIVGYEGVFLVALTNVPKDVPEAILRRFKFIDVVGQLSRQERSILFRQFLEKGLPIAGTINEDQYLKWADLLIDAPGDVLGKVADEVHFKFMHDLVGAHPDRVSTIERTLAKRFKEREINNQDRVYLKKALSEYKFIEASDISEALDSVLKQPQVQLQINKAKKVYRDADELMQGLSTVGDTGIGFGSKVGKKSEMWR